MMLECFHYDFYSYEEAIKRWKINPQVIDNSDAYSLKSIINENHTSCFGLKELDLNGEYTIKGNGNFYVAVVYSGEGIIQCNGKELGFKQGDEIFLSAAIEEVTFKSNIESRILIFYPPN